MFKLPVCPYCYAIYRYSEIGKLKEKECDCYHCGKRFSVNRKLKIVPVLIVCAVLVLINLYMMHTSIDINLFPMIIIDASAIFLSLLYVPFTIRFVPINSRKFERKKNNRKQKNKPKKTDR